MKKKMVYFELRQPSIDSINCPEDAAVEMAKVVSKMTDSFSEYVVVMAMEPRGNNVAFVAAQGAINSVSLAPADIFRRIFLTAPTATRFIIAHNHPSGETAPSEEDLVFTRRIAAASKIMGLEFCDHVIVGSSPDDFFAFSRNGLI